MKSKNYRLNIWLLRASLVVLLCFGSYKYAEARFWGRDVEVLFATLSPSNLEVNSPGTNGMCTVYYVETYYVLWVKVRSTDRQSMDVPCQSVAEYM